MLRQRFAQFAQLPCIPDGDSCLVGEALQQVQLGGVERPQDAAVNDQRADRAALGPQRRASHGANSGAAGNGRSRPICERVVEVVEIRQMDLPVFADDRARQVAAADGPTNGRVGKEIATDLLCAFADADRQFELATFGNVEGHADGAEQPRRGLGDLAQRAVGVARGGGNGAQNVGGSGQSLPRLGQFALQIGRCRDFGFSRRCARRPNPLGRNFAARHLRRFAALRPLHPGPCARVRGTILRAGFPWEAPRRAVIRVVPCH